MPTIRANDAELFYEETGSGAPVLLLHGLGSSGEDWAPQVDALAKRHRVIALDLRGSGRSRDLAHPAGPFSIPQLADDAALVLERLGACPAHVVGLSLGGLIAFQLAIHHPSSVRTLTIVNSGPAFVPRTLKEHAAVALRLGVARLFGPAGMSRMLAKRLFPRPDQQHLRARFVERMSRNDKRAYAATQRAVLGFSVLDRIGEIDVPTLVVAADQDYTPVSAKEAYARKMKKAKVVVVPDARHALPIEDPEKFNPILTEFLASGSP